MPHDTFGYEETAGTETPSAPPLCLVHYFAERSAYPPEREPHPPGPKARGRVAARRGNLIILEFSTPPSRREHSRKGKMARVCDVLMLLLLLASVGACLAAFRF